MKYLVRKTGGRIYHHLFRTESGEVGWDELPNDEDDQVYFKFLSEEDAKYHLNKIGREEGFEYQIVMDI